MQTNKKITILNLRKNESHTTTLQEGVYKAHIIDMQLEEDVKTIYGNTNRLSIEYEVLNGNAIKRVTQLIYISDSPNSACAKFCNEISDALNLDDDDDIAVIVNQFVDVELSVKASQKGRQYSFVEHILPYTGHISDWDKAKGIKSTAPKLPPKSLAEDLINDVVEEGDN